ncbi:uncharacterized protein LOC141586622 [Silene latifolia]|uniref:uncharacterized protein LOC141586622 n=1 Tax=Silene latifolia TaxID=37657 RepID=UPI003D77F14C
MSWLARSIANSLRIDDDDESPPQLPPRNPPENAAEERESDGVKEDLTVFKESLTRQLWGVANFLAPPPPPPLPPTSYRRVGSGLTQPESNSGNHEFDEDDQSPSSPYRRDHMKFRNFDNDENDEVLRNCELRTVVEDDDENGGNDWIGEVAGLTDEVLTFAGNIGHHPETWLDFPVEDDEDFDDFPMSESQKRHTQAVEHLTPRLAALRIELCPAHMSVGFFWKVYFVLLHSRLNKQDAELLSTPEIVEARAEWMQELQKRAKKEPERYNGGRYGSADFDEDYTPTSLQNDHSETHSSWTFASEPATSSTTADSDTEKHVGSTEMQYPEKAVIDEKPFENTNYKYKMQYPEKSVDEKPFENTHYKYKMQCSEKSFIDEKPFENANYKNFTPSVSKTPALQFDDDDDDDDWPEDDCLVQNGKVIPVGIDEDISFSDLEDDDCCIPVISKPDFPV